MHSSNRTTQQVALVYDHLLTEYGGAEEVLQVLLEAFPDAPIFTTVFDPQKAPWISSERVTASQIPQLLRPLFRKRVVLDLCAPFLLEQHDLSAYSVIISVTTTAAKGVLTLPDQLHICYLLSPPRYLYHQAEELQSQSTWLQLPLIRRLGQVALSYLRWWDQVAASRPDMIVTLSKTVAARIREVYNREPSEVLYPPVTLDTASLGVTANSPFPPFLLVLSRLVSYKRVDLAVAAALRTEQLLCIAGTGSELESLQSQAGAAAFVRTNQTLFEAFRQAVSEKKKLLFLGRVTPSEKLCLLEQAAALIMVGREDFGLTAVEALISGTPVIIHAESGVAEVLTKQDCVKITEQTTDAVVSAIKIVSTLTVTPARKKQLRTQLSSTEFVRKLHNLIFPIHQSRARMSDNREGL